MGSICTFECSGRSGLTMWRNKSSDFEIGLYCLGLYFLAYTSQSDWELLLLLGIQHLNFPTNSRTNTTIPASTVHTQKHFYTLSQLHPGEVAWEYSLGGTGMLGPISSPHDVMESSNKGSHGIALGLVTGGSGLGTSSTPGRGP